VTKPLIFEEYPKQSMHISWIGGNEDDNTSIVPPHVVINPAAFARIFCDITRDYKDYRIAPTRGKGMNFAILTFSKGLFGNYRKLQKSI
jgi:hypothetical protein